MAARLALPLLLIVLALGGAAAQGQPDDAKPVLSGGAPAGAPLFAESPPRVQPAATDAPVIMVWYGANQSYGERLGRRSDPQRWVNILGNVAPAAGVSLNYTLNGGPAVPLTLGPDNRRLALAGDFNIELPYTALKPGTNQVVISASGAGGQDQETVTINYTYGAPAWTPGGYVFNWIGSINNTGQVVDGEWKLDGGGVRPTVFDYDRLIALGDLAWRDYTVTVPITVFSVDPSGYAGPSNGPGVGFLTRWNGHYDSGTGTTPLTGWSQIGALAWYRWQKSGDVFTEQFQLIGNNSNNLGTSNKELEIGTTYNFKLNIVSSGSPDIAAFYRFKVWPAAAAEPATWDIENRGQKDEPRFGSMVLVAHHVDARFGPVTVQLDSVQPYPTINVTVAGEGSGSVVTTPPGPAYRFWDNVSLLAVPSLGSGFSHWQGALTGSTNPAVIENITGNVNVTAVFDESGNYLVVPVVLGSPGD